MTKDFRKVAVKIMADADGGEADAVVSDWFREQNGLLRADILQDAIDDLQQMYDNAFGDMVDECREKGAE
mgnify:CR=1 FL=1